LRNQADLEFSTFTLEEEFEEVVRTRLLKFHKILNFGAYDRNEEIEYPEF
jgi:hypothetical protein